MVYNRKRKDNRSSSFMLNDNPKRTKVQAQRKFAQGSNVNSPVFTPIQQLKRQEKVMPEPIELLPMKRPNTEDFFTFLCFRGTPVLHPSLNFFNNAAMVDTRTRTDEMASTCPKNGMRLSSISTSQSGEKPFVAFGVRKRADPIVVSRHMDKKRRHALALQALRRKYQEQKMARIRAITISKLSEKVHTNKAVVRKTKLIPKTGTITKKNRARKTKIAVVAKRVKVTTRRTSALKQPLRSNMKQKMCLRSYRGRFVQRELVNKSAKKRLVHTVVKKLLLKAELEENGENNAEADSSDDDKPLVKRKFIRTRKATETRLTRSPVTNKARPRRIPVHNQIALRTQNAIKLPQNSPRLRSQYKMLRSKQETRMPATRRKIAVTKKAEIKQKTIAKQVDNKGITRVVRKVPKPKITEEEKRELKRLLPSRTTQSSQSTRSGNRSILNRTELNKTSVAVRKVLHKKAKIKEQNGAEMSKVPDNGRKCNSIVIEKKPRKQKNFNDEKRITRETTKLMDAKHNDSRRTTRNKRYIYSDNEKRKLREFSKIAQEKRARVTTKNLEEAEGKPNKPIVNARLTSKIDTVNHDVSEGAPLKKTGKVIDGNKDKTERFQELDEDINLQKEIRRKEQHAELKLRNEEQKVAIENLAKLESDDCGRKFEVENVVLVENIKEVHDERNKKQSEKVSYSKRIVQSCESEVRNCRPSRKSKEAASIYMEILGHKLNQENDDIDDLFIDSFPELPNVLKKPEQRIAKKVTQVTQSKIKEKLTTHAENPKACDNNETNLRKMKPGNSSDSESKRNRDSVQKKSPRKSKAKRNQTSRNSKLATESDESFAAEITLPTEISVRPSRNKSPKLYKSFSDTDSDEAFSIVQKPVKRKSKEKAGSVKKKAKHIRLTVERDSFSESDDEPLVKLAQKPAKKRPARKFDGEIIVGKQKRECAKRPQNYLASFPSSDEDDNYFHGFVKSDLPTKAKAVEPSIGLICSDVERRYFEEKVKLSNERIEKWLNDNVLVGMDVIKKENDEMLKFGEKIPTATTLEKCRSPNKPIVNELKQAIYKERTKQLAKINAFSVCKESSVHADNEDSISTPFKRPGKRPSSTATSRS